MRLKLRLKDFYRLFGMRGMFLKIKQASGKPSLFTVSQKGIKLPFFLRLNTTDIQAYKEIILRDEYHLMLRKSPKVIIDAGANIGLTAIYFASRYPDAKIYSIEPEPSNFELLVKNTEHYQNIFPIHAALWNEDVPIQVVDCGLGHWGFQTATSDGVSSLSQVPGLTLRTIMADRGIDYIDLLKIDVEGAEKEVFKGSPEWIDKVGVLIVELHDRLKAGCSRSFFNATNAFEHEWYQGENVVLARSDYFERIAAQ